MGLFRRKPDVATAADFARRAHVKWHRRPLAWSCQRCGRKWFPSDVPSGGTGLDWMLCPNGCNRADVLPPEAEGARTVA